MKRFIIGLFLLLLAVSASMTSYFVFDRKTDVLHSSLQALLRTAQSGEKKSIEVKTKELLVLWDETSPILHAMINHRNMDVLEIDVLGLPRYLDDDNMELFREACIRGLSELENIKSAETPLLENIF